MDREGLKQYFNIGSPEKILKARSPLFKRDRIGQFGIGKFASLSACECFEVYTQKGDFAAVLAGLARLRNRKYHKHPLSKPVGDDLFELRHVGKLNTRVLYFFMRGRRIILVHGIRKKARALSARDRKIALERKRDWLARNPG